MRRLRLVLVVVALLMAALPAGAGRPEDPERALVRTRATAAVLQARTEAIRADLDSGSFERAVGRLATMADVQASSTEAAAPRAVRGLPPAVAAPIADLLAAARDAAAGMRSAIRTDDG